MARDDWRSTLRAAVYRADGEQVVALARAGYASHPDPLQLMGDGLLAALVRRVAGARGAAAECASALRERGWDGDDELADQLLSRLGEHPTPMLRPLPVDLEALAGILEGDPMDGGGRIDVRTGEVWPEVVIEYSREIGELPDEEDEEDDERWLWVHTTGSRAGYRDMQRFVDDCPDEVLADRLAIAIQGRGAFRRFKDVLARSPEALEGWFAFSDERSRGRARAWLADAGYCVAPRPPAL